MIRLRVIKRGRWTVLGVCDERGDCRVATFLDEINSVGGADAHQMQALIAIVARNGPPRNERRSRRLDGPIYELKTRSGIRIPYFYDDGRVVVCTEALRKPKQAELRRVIQRAAATHARYLRAKQRNALVVTEEDA